MRTAVRSRLGLVGLALLVLPLTAPAQPSEALQSPTTFLGYELGEQFTPHHRVVDYMRHVAAHSPRVAHRQYGTSVEGRPLLLATVTAPNNHDRIETLRRDNRKRAGLVEGAPTAAPTAVVWLSYGVHGNESVSTEAALRTLYALGNPQNSRTGAWLDDTVVLLDPLLNPDGRARYVQWYKRMTGDSPNARPAAREHHEPWPGGRTNHYYFDLNRDWAWGVQPETRQRLDAYHRWMPHVHVDFHEMGVDEPYYFAPGAEPFHETLTEWQRDFQFTIGRNNADYFDENGWLYFTEEVFDLFYPGYGDTWPLFNGAVGMTYEQGGSGRAGRAIVTAEDDTLTLQDRLRRHHTTGLSTVEATAEHHERVVRQFEDYYASAQKTPPGEYRTYVVRRDAQGHRLSALADHLDRQRIRYGYATEPRTVRGRSYRSGEMEQTRLQKGDLLVNAAQPKARLAKVLLEPKTTIVDSLTYDITAWSLPYAYGLEALALPESVLPDTGAAPASPASMTGDADAPYAYVTPWTSRADARFAAALLKEGLRLRFATESFTVDDRSFEPGALVLTRAGNTNRTDRFDTTVRRLAEAHGQSLHGASTGLTSQGPDFGSDNVGFLEAPHVAALSGPPTGPSRAGEVWHFFDRQLDYPVTLLPADDFEASMLDDVDVLVLPGGRYGEWLTDARAEALTDWVRQGGRLIAMGAANDALTGQAPYVLTRKPADATDSAADDALTPYDAQTRQRLSGATPGSVHRVQLDDSHPLGFGVEPPYFTLKRNDDAFAYLDEGQTVGALQTPAPVSGFMGHEAQRTVDDTFLFGTQPLGNGQVTYFVDNPLFRGFWYNGQVLFANAVFFVGNG
ncbi:M14 family metallopeptidase [Salinibacter altiplanensis]|uniref:M14 family metallopeptidase n=1 Tax=Salinibacter altiplanensis TaxID=1803181 RepID=UPI000C9F7D8B|nr:M14 family metallopeptidase [Salinibacter altiplanensis]